MLAFAGVEIMAIDSDRMVGAVGNVVAQELRVYGLLAVVGLPFRLVADDAGAAALFACFAGYAERDAELARKAAEDLG